MSSARRLQRNNTTSRSRIRTKQSTQHFFPIFNRCKQSSTRVAISLNDRNFEKNVNPSVICLTRHGGFTRERHENASGGISITFRYVYRVRGLSKTIGLKQQNVIAMLRYFLSHFLAGNHCYYM